VSIRYSIMGAYGVMSFKCSSFSGGIPIFREGSFVDENRGLFI
jgi:hypothetical protein